MLSIADKKVCKKCGVEKPVDEFGVVKSSHDGRRYACKECYNGIRQIYRVTHQQEIADYKRKLYFSKHEEQKRRLRDRYPKTRAWKLMREYGMSVEDYDNMLAEQEGRCAICGKKPQEVKGHKKNTDLHVDHCHATGVVRGLLCNPCNVALGSFRDDPVRLKNAIEYLERPKCRPQRNYEFSQPVTATAGTDRSPQNIQPSAAT